MKSNKAWLMGFIEPEIEQRTNIPVEDEITSLLEMAFEQSEGGCYYSMNNFSHGGKWRGTHGNCDGKSSTNKDYKLKNGMVTNSLLVHYWKWFRPALDADEYSKVWALAAYYDKLEKVKECTPQEYHEECEANMKIFEEKGTQIGIIVPQLISANE